MGEAVFDKLSNQTALGHLEVLEAEGILRHVEYGGRIRFYKYDEGSPIAKAVLNMIEVFKSRSD